MTMLSEKLGRVLRWGLPLLVFLLPWQTRYIFAEYSVEFPLYGGASLYGIDILFVVLFAVWLAWMMMDRRWQAIKTHSHKVSGAFEFVLAWAALSLLWTSNDTVSALAWLRLLEASLLVLMLATAPIRRKDIVIAFIAAGVGQSALAIFQFFTQDVFASKWLGMAAQTAARLGASVIEQNELRWLRAYGSLPHPNILGGWLVLSALASLSVYLDCYRRFAREFSKAMLTPVAVSLASFLIIFIGLLLTFSRSAWLGLVIGSLVLLLAMLGASDRAQQKLIAVGFLKISFGALLMLLFLNAFLSNLWLARLRGEDQLAGQSFSEREELILQAQQVIEQHGFRGAGIGSYPAEIMALNKNQEIYKYQPVHNVWLLAFAELGLAGLGLLILWMICWYVFLKSLFSREISPVKFLPYASIFAIGVMAYFDHFWWTLPVGLLAASVWLGLYLRKAD